MSNAQRPIQTDDLYRMQSITDLQLSPDGRHVIYAQQRVDRETEKKRSNLWMIPADGGAPRQFTHGEWNDSAPRWSPDGSQIAFLSNRADEKQPQLYVIPVDGGEARRLTDWQGTFGTVVWSPDGEKLLVQFRQKDAEEIEREKDEKKKELGVVVRHITRLSYKGDGVGFLPQERWHLWLVDVETGEATQLTKGDVHDELSPSWSPDGQSMVYVSNATDDPDRNPTADEIFVIPASGGDARRVPTFEGRKSGPVFSPDGKWIAFAGSEGLDQFWKPLDLWIVPADGSGPARNLTRRFDVALGSLTLSDTASYKLDAEPVWSADGRRIFFSISQDGSTVLKSLAVDDERARLEPVVEGTGAVGVFDFDAECRRVAYLCSTPTEPGQIWVRDLDGGQAQQRTHLNRDLLAEIQWGGIEEVWIDGPETRLQGWIMTPPDFDDSQTYPAILEIHGGPMLQYGFSFMHEFHWLAAQGYVVFFTNPRGSQGYGTDFVSAIWNDFGGPAYEDLMAWTDHVAALPYVDESRLGVTGGSYGGYMTNWIIGHTDRFGAAVTQRSLSNLISFNGSSDIWIFQLLFGGKPAWESLDDYWRQSPIAYVGNVSTPTLVIHSDQDLRVSIEQGEQMFVALKLRGVETEMVRFPEESHGLSRTGRTDRRVARLAHMLRWFDRYLK